MPSRPSANQSLPLALSGVRNTAASATISTMTTSAPRLCTVTASVAAPSSKFISRHHAG
ncbi:hypothetical protein BN133_668 [Cronobacter dublinensis 582]|nr:hypothetical protein BN133_668 [Cronobacter dublinensis 582]